MKWKKKLVNQKIFLQFFFKNKKTVIRTNSFIIDDFLNNNSIPNHLFSIQKLCVAVKTFIRLNFKDLETESLISTFKSRINRKWNNIKSQILDKSEEDVKFICLKSMKSFKRICFTTILENVEEENFDTLIELLATHYQGGSHRLRRDHPNIKKDLELGKKKQTTKTKTNNILLILMVHL